MREGLEVEPSQARIQEQWLSGKQVKGEQLGSARRRDGHIVLFVQIATEYDVSKACASDRNPEVRIRENVVDHRRSSTFIDRQTNAIASDSMDGVVDDAGDGGRGLTNRRRYVSANQYSASAGRTASEAIEGQNIVHQHYTWRGIGCIQRYQITHCTWIWPRARANGGSGTTKSGGRVIASRRIHSNSVGQGTGDHCGGDQQLTLISKYVRVAEIFTPLGVQPKLHELQRHVRWECRSTKDIGSCWTIELNDDRPWCRHRRAGHVPAGFRCQSDQTARECAVDRIANRCRNEDRRVVGVDANGDRSRRHSEAAIVRRGHDIKLEQHSSNAIAQRKGCAVLDFARGIKDQCRRF